MTEQETRELLRLAQEGSEEASEKLIEAYKNLIKKVVNKFRYTYVPEEDIYQLALIGFYKAITRFDFDSNNKFITYAYTLSHSEIYRYLRDDGFIRIPRPIQKIERLINQNNCANKSPSQIAEIIGVNDIDLINETLKYITNGKVFSLNMTVHENNDGAEITLEDMVVSGDNDWTDSVFLQDALKILDEREKQIIELRYVKDMFQWEVGEVLGLSQVHIGRIENRALKKIREYLGVQQAPKVVKPKKEKKAASGPKELRGDRDRAIHLLKTSTLSSMDIANMTGVPVGTMYKLSKAHRPKAIADIIKSRPTKVRGELNVFKA